MLEIYNSPSVQLEEKFYDVYFWLQTRLNISKFAEIRVTFDDDCDGLAGAVHKWDDGSFDIEIDSNNDLEEVIKTFLHEMVHVKQYLDKRLSHPSTARFAWNGEVWDGRYSEQPWEIEAFEMEEILYEEFKLL